MSAIRTSKNKAEFKPYPSPGPQSQTKPLSAEDILGVMATAGPEPLAALATILGPLLGRELTGNEVAKASSLGSISGLAMDQGKNKLDPRAQLVARLKEPSLSSAGETLSSAVRSFTTAAPDEPNDPPGGPVYCINRWTSSPAETSPGLEEAIAELFVADVAAELGVEPARMVVAIRTGSAEIELALWRANNNGKRRLPSGAILIPAHDFIADVTSGKTGHLVLDGAVALSANFSVLGPVIKALAEKDAASRISIIAQTGSATYPARDLHQVVPAFDAYLRDTLLWPGPDCLTRGEQVHLLQELSICSTRWELYDLNVVCSASPAAELARRWAVAFLWQRMVSLVYRYSTSAGVNEQGETDARRWRTSRGRLADLVRKHSNSATMTEEEQLEGVEDVDASGDAANVSHSEVGWLYRHGVGWCASPFCDSTEPVRTSCAWWEGQRVEACTLCKRVMQNPERFERGGIQGTETPTEPNRVRTTRVNKERVVCQNPHCAAVNDEPQWLAPDADGVYRCRSCQSHFKRFKKERTIIPKRASGSRQAKSQS